MTENATRPSEPTRQNNTSTKPILILGYGTLAKRLTSDLRKEGTEVFSVSRTPHESQGEDHTHLTLNLHTKDPFPDSIRAQDYSTTFILLSADERSEEAYKALYQDTIPSSIQTLKNPGHVVFVSSTAVYEQDQGQWVDETTPTAPKMFRGRMLLAAEKALSELVPLSILRFSGLYGYANRPLMSPRRLQAMVPGRWLNHIHLEDALGLLTHVKNHRPERSDSELILGSDPNPCRSDDVLGMLGQAPVPEEPPQGPSSGKRCRSQVIGKTLLYDWKHPSFLRELETDRDKTLY